MNIGQIQTLDDGVNGVSAVGTVTYTKPAVNRVGDKDGRQYDFWSQFVVIKDASGEMGVHLTVGAGEEVFKGQQIAVEKGKVGSYYYDKTHIRKTLSGSLVSGQSSVHQGQQAPQQPRQAPNVPLRPPQQARPQIGVSDAERHSSICRQCAGKIAGEIFASQGADCPIGILLVAELVALAHPLAEWFITGKLPRQPHPDAPEPDGYDASNVPDPDPSIQESSSDPLGDIPF